MPGLRTSGGCRFNERHQTIGLAFTSHFKEEPSGDGFHQELLSWRLLRLSSINKNKNKIDSYELIEQETPSMKNMAR